MACSNLTSGKSLGNLDGGVHVAEGGGEDEAGAVAREAGDGAFRVRPLRHVLDEYRLDHVPELVLDHQAPLVVGVGPSVVADRADVDEADLQLVRARDRAHRERQGEAGGQCEQFLHLSFSS